MPATSQQQQKLFGLALSVKRGDTPRSEVSDEVLQIVDTMSEKKIKDFAETSHKGLPTKVETFIRGMVRETFRTKVLGETPYKLHSESVNEGSMSDIDIIAQESKNFKDFVKEFYKEYKDFEKTKEILKWLEGIYKNRSTVEEVVTENLFIPKVGTIDDFKLKDLLMKNPKVNAVLGDGETTFMKKSDVVVIMHQSKRFNTIFTDGKQEFEIDMKVGKLVKPLSKARKEIVAHFSKSESVDESSKSPKFKVGDVVNYLPKLSGLNPNKKLVISRVRYEAGDNLTTTGWYYSFKGMNLGANENDIKLVNSVNEEVEQLDEKLIVYSNRAPYGQVVFIAGGAGSGKGYAVSNFLDSSSFRVRDVDEMKKQLQKLNTIGKLSIQQIVDRFGKKIKPADLEGIKKIQSDGYDLKTMDLKKPDHVYALHILVKAMDIKDQTLVNMLGAAKNPEALPNIMFDITAKEIADITDVLPQLLAVGYKPNNIHLAWVLASYQLAIKSNQERDRVVPADILLKTHIGAGNTIWGLVTKALPKDMNGRVDVILNNRENTIPFTEKDEKTPIKVQARGKKKPEIVVKSFLSLPVKKQGGGILPETLWKDLLYKWIKDNGPKELTANM